MIIVPLDGSPLAETALPHARSLLQPGESLVLVRVVPSSAMPAAAVVSVRDALQAEGERYLSQFSEEGHLLHGSVRDTLIHFLEERKPRLTVLASQGRSGFQRWFLGSVAESVARAAPCPLWIVRSESLARSRVLVPLDGSEHSCRALELLPWLGASSVVLVGATDLGSDDLHAMLEPEQRDGLLHALKASLEAQASALRGTYEVSVHVEDGLAADVILAEAERAQVDCIAMASHGRTGLSRWLLGSVAERVLRHSRWSMALVAPGS